MPTWLTRLHCQIFHRDRELRIDPPRMFLRCLTCHTDSPGWDLHDDRPMAHVPRTWRRIALGRIGHDRAPLRTM